jgi:hypothetical protein
VLAGAGGIPGRAEVPVPFADGGGGAGALPLAPFPFALPLVVPASGGVPLPLAFAESVRVQGRSLSRWLIVGLVAVVVPFVRPCWRSWRRSSSQLVDLAVSHAVRLSALACARIWLLRGCMTAAPAERPAVTAEREAGDLSAVRPLLPLAARCEDWAGVNAARAVRTRTAPQAITRRQSRNSCPIPSSSPCT